ncbi:MAG: class I SAM-dependent RNA methyltransferase, partial [Candidatus Zixiibacteriota bacterium]
MTSKKTLTYTATTHSGLEGVLADELTALGAVEVERLQRAVSFRGDKRLLYRANLWLRTATRILLPLREFNASSADKLYRQSYSIDWGKYLTAKMTFAVRATVNRSEIDNSMFAALKVKDAVVDHLRKQTGVRPSVDTDNPDVS